MRLLTLLMHPGVMASAAAHTAHSLPAPLPTPLTHPLVRCRRHLVPIQNPLAHRYRRSWRLGPQIHRYTAWSWRRGLRQRMMPRRLGL